MTKIRKFILIAALAIAGVTMSGCHPHPDCPSEDSECWDWRVMGPNHTQCVQDDKDDHLWHCEDAFSHRTWDETR